MLKCSIYSCGNRGVIIYRLAETAEKVNISQIDLAALENMPLNQLQQLVQDLQRDLHKNFHYQ